VLAIDTGFIVHNERTYPTLLRIFAELGVATQDSEMSMSTRDDATGLEWAGALGAAGLFPTGRNLARPAYLRMLTEIPRFHRAARRLLEEHGDDTTLRAFLDAHGFTAYFARHFMEPVVAAVWSCDPDVALDYPARYLFSFLDHHGMLGVFGSPEWKTVVGGSRSYVDRIGARLDDVRLGTPVRSVLETAHGVEVVAATGHAETFDAVVIATHPDQALAMLADPTPTQSEVLAALPYSANPALLHTDMSLLPQARKARASWNFRRVADDRGQVTVTYDLTRLMRLPTETHYLVTLGGEERPQRGVIAVLLQETAGRAVEARDLGEHAQVRRAGEVPPGREQPGRPERAGPLQAGRVVAGGHRHLAGLGGHPELGEDPQQRRVGPFVVHDEAGVDREHPVRPGDVVGVGVTTQPVVGLVQGDAHALVAGRDVRRGQPGHAGADHGEPPWH
jgi:predicted NAD/FAD-binding protein